MFDGLYLPPKPAIIIPRPREILRHGEPRFRVPELAMFVPAPFIFGGDAVGYRYFRLNVSANNGGTNLLVGELKIFDGATQHPTAAMTSLTAPSPYVASASTTGSGGQPAWKGFNRSATGGDADDSWSASTSSGWLKLDVGAGNEFAPTSYRVTGSTSATNQSPNAWTFEGSNNDTDWDALDTVSGEASWSQSEERTYTL